MVVVAAVGGLPHGQLGNFPIKKREGVLQGRPAQRLDYLPIEEAVRAAFLRPLRGERLKLLILETSEIGLRQAIRMVSTLTGAAQPDFVVFGKSAAWEGVGGTLAMGFLDHSWNISAASCRPVRQRKK